MLPKNVGQKSLSKMIFVCFKKIWVKKILDQKIFGSKNYLGKKKICQKTFWVEKKCLSKEIWVKKI